MNLKSGSQKYVVLIVLLLFGILMVYRYNYVNEINKNPVAVVGKVYKISISKYTVHNVKYIYYYKNHSYEGSSKVDSEGNERYIGNFYEVTISKEDPKKNQINLNKQIFDTTEITKSGFNVKR
ncbi:hypothetical protein [Aequorivita xiaoshiensis]|uniref:Uncharacterized protein n=1 Tax=Aequorivita xiaoshiensis TaxID=2874476 RepID=A0A9X1UCM9_9FLAO|nr:hypothetical protein [Aequorivita xiaoshiensis]MCG2430771.1 hypothetical protein [Aequorivita xiaoshiensis]